MDQGGAERILEVSRRRTGDYNRRPHDCGQRRKSRHSQAKKGLGSGVFEIALSYRGDAYRALYAVQIDEDIWVVHAFQKKSRKGIKTPQKDIELIRERLKQLKEQLK
jgi:phage-related protein